MQDVIFEDRLVKYVRLYPTGGLSLVANLHTNT